VAMLGGRGTTLPQDGDLATGHGPDAFVFTTLRLFAGDEVDEAKAPNAESRVGIAVSTGRVGTAMGQCVAHPTHVRVTVTLRSADDAGDATHVSRSPWMQSRLRHSAADLRSQRKGGAMTRLDREGRV